jgi:Na+-driven multidrug efflux pump/anti-sigma regulatory factor (Ser/Thr protein kinase)
MLAILGSTLGQIVTAVIIGRALGPQELSVIGITLPIYYVFATAGALLGVGGTAVCARLIGQDRFKESRAALTAIYLMTAVAATVLTGIMLVFSGQIIVFLGVTPDMEIFPKVRDFMRILSSGGVFIMSIYPAFNLLRLDGKNGSVIVVFAVMSTVSILVVSLLVSVMGVAGAAAATICGNAAAGVLGAVLLFTGSKNFQFALPGKKIFNLLVRDIIVSGSPSALENMCILTRTVIFNWILIAMLFDMNALSAFKVTDSVNSFAQIFIAGASGSMIPFIGVFSSEKDVKSTRQLLTLGFKWGCAMTFVFTVICLVFASQAAGLFGMSGGESLVAAVPAIRIFALSLPLAAVNNILVCLYQANRNTTAANILTLGRSFVWVVLAAFILSPRTGAIGLWHSFWISELIALVLAVPISFMYLRKNKNLSTLFLLDNEVEAKGIYKSFSVHNSMESIAESIEGINDFCSSNRLDPKQTIAIKFSIEEMLVMIREYCFKKDSGDTVNVRVLIYGDIIILRIRNGGKAFNPIAYYMKQKLDMESKSSVIDIMSDTLGISMVLKMASKVDYRSTFGVNNLTVII